MIAAVINCRKFHIDNIFIHFTILIPILLTDQ